jgi:hypothetical protein
MEFVPNRVEELGKEMGLSEEEMEDFLVVRRGGEGVGPWSIFYPDVGPTSILQESTTL